MFYIISKDPVHSIHSLPLVFMTQDLSPPHFFCFIHKLKFIFLLKMISISQVLQKETEIYISKKNYSLVSRFILSNS